MKFIDLFCGIGSFHQSFKPDHQCVMACDINKYSKLTYELNYGITPLGDICDIEPCNIEPCDILCAGFPCQPWSQAGKHQGFDDDRGTMFFQVMKFITSHKPKFVIIENVQSLLSHNNGESFEKMRKSIQDDGYTVIYKVFKCSDYGIPQMRKRLFIVALRNDVKRECYEDILDFSEYAKTVTLSQFFNKNYEKKEAYTIRCGGRGSHINNRHNWDSYMVDGEIHRLTITEALMLQGFDLDFQLVGPDTHKWKMLGNTIPVVFTEMLAKNINKYIAYHTI
jgi:DNA (cytosine-5)-methyltransferase 1